MNGSSTKAKDELREQIKRICYDLADDLLRGGSDMTGGDYADQIMQLISAHDQQLLARIRAGMPEKQYYPKRLHLSGSNPIGTQHYGFNKAIDQVTAVIKGIEDETK